MYLFFALLLVLAPHDRAREATRETPRTAATERQPGLVARNRLFLEAVRSRRPSRIAAFFPRHGTFEYVFTEHKEDGDHRQSKRFPARSAEREISGGALWTSFDIQYESQPIGLLAHQVMIRGTEW